MAWQVQLRRNGKWISGKTHPQKKDATEDAIQKWKAQAFEGYQLKEVK